MPETSSSMRTFKSRFAFLFFLGAAVGLTNAATLPFQTVFKGREKFDYLVQQAQANNWKSLPIGDRTAAVGRALVGTRYKSFTLEIDDQVEAPSANFFGMDCWTFFEIALGFARMLNESTGGLDTGDVAALCRARSLSQRPLHRRISVPPALP